MRDTARQAEPAVSAINAPQAQGHSASLRSQGRLPAFSE